MRRFPGFYQDAHGFEEVVFTLEDAALSTTIRGVHYAALQPEDFESESGETLQACTYGFTVPLTLVTPESTEPATLSLTFRLSAEGGALTVRLLSPTLSLSATASDTYFDTVLERLLAQLPDGYQLQFCFACRWGVVEPCYGLNGNFGCFRTQPDVLAAAPSRHVWMHLWPPPEVRQEFDVCASFTPR